VVLEDGTTLRVEGTLPPDLPLGYHRIEGPSSAGGPGPTQNLIVSPGRTALSADLRIWGLTCQLYAVRSSRSWGIGDLADLRRLSDWAAERGAGVVGLNPLHAPEPLPHPADSPYSPSSRRWRDPLYLAIDDVPGAASVIGLDDLRRAGRALNAGERIDRTAVWATKRAALELLWNEFSGSPSHDRFVAERGADLTRWATYCALADHHQASWRTWPDQFRQPDSPAVAAFAAGHPRQVGFWAWLQWLIDEQIRPAGAPLAVSDLAVGFSADGADAWEWQDLLAQGVRIGAPPDILGPDGQDWGLPPFIPWRLRDAGYQPLASTIRAAVRHARGLRIDHVMGLFRLWWVPPSGGAVDGAYVRYPGRELLDVVALESARAGALVVGEDLGTVEAGVRAVLAEAGVLSTRLLLFEDDPPSTWIPQAMAAVTTHDLPTIAGVWSGVDLADRRAAGTTIPADGDDDFRRHLGMHFGTADPDPSGRTVDEVIVDTHRQIAASPCVLATATLDDLVGAEHRPNVPGTIDEHPNWRIPLPLALDDLPGYPLADAVVAAISETRPSG